MSPHETRSAAAATLAELRRASQSRGTDRDPRAAPIPIHKTVAVAETCRFYGAQDVMTSCRVPRSCQDCLQMPGCVVTKNGLCESVHEPWLDTAYVDDYHVATEAYPFGDAYNGTRLNASSYHYFYSANATYCSAADSICSDCRATFQSLARSPRTVDQLGSQFCVGLDGCVCIAVCEVPGLLAVRAFDTQCVASKKDLPRFADPDGPTPMSFSSTHRDPRAPLVTVFNQRVDETCEFHSTMDVRGCRQPRSCSDCLQRDECLINGHRCTGMSEYKPALDFRYDPYVDRRYVQFPAANTTYCPAADPICRSCRADFENKAKRVDRSKVFSYDNYRANGTYCVGLGGCVCVELCENPQVFYADASDRDCKVASKGSAIEPGFLAIIYLGSLLLVGCIYYAVKKSPQRSQATVSGDETSHRVHGLRRHMLDQAPAMNLDLYGWRRFRQDLLAKEEELLAGAHDVSPVSRPVDFEFVAPTAPDFDDDDSSAPTVFDPTALASAPALRTRHSSSASGLRHRTPGDFDQSAPTAPDFDDD